jgi:hypothetical protein
MLKHRFVAVKSDLIPLAGVSRDGRREPGDAPGAPGASSGIRDGNGSAGRAAAAAAFIPPSEKRAIPG